MFGGLFFGVINTHFLKLQDKSTEFIFDTLLTKIKGSKNFRNSFVIFKNGRRTIKKIILMFQVSSLGPQNLKKL